MSGLSPQMLAAIQAAGQTEANPQGQGDNQIDQTMMNSLQNSGLFSPEQLQGAQSQFVSSPGTWGNAPGDVSDWDSMMQNGIAGVGNSQATVGQFQQNPNTPNAQAIAGGYNPLQPAYLPQPGQINATTVNPSYANTAQLSPQLMNSLGSGNTVNALVQANQPQFQQQDQQMMQMLATAGLAPSSTAGGTAFNNLAQQQLAGMDPSIAAAIQNSQSNQLNAGQYNTSAQNAGNQYNAGVGNNASQFNANAQNQAANTNLTNQNNQQLYNANAFNNAGTNYFNAMTGSYNNNANAFNALNTAGLQGAQNAGQTQAQGGNQLAAGSQNTFPSYGAGSNAYGALGAAAGQYQTPTPGANAGYASYGTNYASTGGDQTGLNGVM